jgi:hypothetical protein
VLRVNRAHKLHASANLSVNGTRIEHVDAFAALAMREAVAEVVDVTVGLARLSFD